ncbi:MAG: hydantoinase B/oxoprolinase family protein [Anaerolineae bacterium]|nr:MAG: hydantoinase B/oxoprolinase family protein [Anaerolineae bacterium]
MNAIELELFKHRFAAIADEMGGILRRAAASPNIKERRDFSCAVFNARGEMIAQAAHIPVHLGAMPLSVAAAVRKFGDSLRPGDAVMLNDPFQGGTHLPDITLVSPVFTASGDLLGFVASRAHHADVGGMAPGSMPVAREIYQEGLILPPVRIQQGGELVGGILDILLANVRTPDERRGDLLAQLAANRRGVQRLEELATEHGASTLAQAADALLDYTERMTRALLADLPDGVYAFEDALDDDGVSEGRVPLRVTVTIAGESATVDFSGSALQRAGSVNAVYAITLSAVYYVFRCLIGLDVPNNAGCLRPIRVIAPEGTVLNAQKPAPVAGGNVETSQRIVDILLGALAQACPQRVPAASQGTMNNVTIGGMDAGGAPFAYYETIGGGGGARPNADGVSGRHSHMTNTLNTPAEALEYAYPLRVLRYEIRRGTGGAGHFRGGDGLRRDVQALVPCQVTLLSERRVTAPYGLHGGQPGACGENVLLRGKEEIPLPGKGTFEMQAGDVLSIRTPGGGGWGK